MNEQQNTQEVQTPPAKNNNVLTLISILFFMLMLAGILYLGYQNYLLQQRVELLSTQLAREIIITTEEKEDVAEKENTYKICSNSVLGLKITIPEDWECKSEELSDIDGLIELTSDKYTIQMSNLGRGAFCGNGTRTNVDESCQTTLFAENEKVKLTMYTSYGEDKEIFGEVAPSNDKEVYPGTWISIKYGNMENQELTAKEKGELLEILDTISLIQVWE